MKLEPEILSFLSNWVPTQRWARLPEPVSEWRPVIRQSMPGFELLVAEPVGQPSPPYFVPIIDPQHPRDAIPEPDFQRWLFHGFSEAGDENVDLQWRASQADWHPGEPHQIHVLAPDSSNAVLAVDGTYLVKVFRLLTRGRNPEPELLAWLADRGFRDIPEFHGSVCVRLDGEWSDLASIQKLMPGARDLWSDLLERTRKEAESDDLVFGTEALPLLEETAAILARFHAVTAGGGDSGPFATERVQAHHLAEWMARLEEQRKLAFDLIQTSKHPLATAAMEAVSGSAIENTADWPLEDPLGLLVRVHGDFHLAQVLQDADGLKLIDFEGEPLRSREERIKPDSPLRDLAGLVRSVEYLGASASMEGPGVDENHVDEWIAQAQQKVQARYFEELEIAGGSHALPANPVARERLLQLFILEKAFYELRYEFLHREHFVAVPLAGISRLRGVRP